MKDTGLNICIDDFIKLRLDNYSSYQDKEYKAQEQKAEELLNKLSELLQEEHFELLYEFDSVKTFISCLLEYHAYKQGFKDAVNFILGCRRE